MADETSDFAIDVDGHTITITVEPGHGRDLDDLTEQVGAIDGITRADREGDAGISVDLDEDASIAEVTTKVQDLLR